MPSSDRVWRERGLHAAILAGDEQAWRTLYEDAYAALDAYVLWRSGGLRDVADDIIQETWLTAIRRIRAFEPEKAPFVAWLRGIAANRFRNECRRSRPATLTPGHDCCDTEKTSERDRAERVSQTLAALPDRYEAVLRAKYLDQESVEAIARAWKESPKAIESLLHRAREAFREAFGRRDGQGVSLREA